MTEARRPTPPGPARSQLAKGVAWGAIAKTVSQSVAWIATLFVARYLTPTDYGIFGLAMLYLGLLQLVSDLGIGTAILANRHITDDDLPQINGLARLGGMVGMVFVAATSPLVGAFFRTDGLPLLLVALSPIFFINSLRTVPQTLLQREFRFKWLAFLDAGQAITLAVASVLLARAGFGYWTLAIAAILSSVVNTLVVLGRRNVPAQWPEVKRLRPLLAFSTQVILQRIAWYISSNADFAVAGRMIGQAGAGNYMFAWNLANAPLDRVGSLVLQVSPAVLGAASKDRDALRRHVLHATQMIAMVIFPMCLGLALVAEPFILTLLGEKWRSAIVPLQVLAAYTAVRALVPLLGQVLLVVGEEHFATRLMFINIFVMTTAFIIGATLAGIVGIAAAYVIAHPFVASAYASRALERIGCSWRMFFMRAIWPALACTIAMAAVVWSVGQITAPLAVKWVLASQLAAGALSYPLAAQILFPERVAIILVALRLKRAPGA